MSAAAAASSPPAPRNAASMIFLLVSVVARVPSGDPSFGNTVPVSGFAGGGKRLAKAFLRFPTMFMYMNGPPGTYVHSTKVMVATIHAAGTGKPYKFTVSLTWE